MPLKIKQKIVFIGAGNLASNLAPALKSSGFEIAQVYSRTARSAQQLAKKLLCSYTTQIKNIYKEADIYIICVKDDVIKKVAEELKLPGKLVIHTSGSTSIKALEKASENTGVLYPLQSFTRTKKTSFTKIPVFVEGSNVKAKKAVTQLASQISNSVIPLKSEDRQRLHIAAVFACNFTNHLFRISEELLKESGLKFSYLYPLILETTKRTETLSPSLLQTGPAARNDKKTIKKHLALLKKQDTELTRIYKLLSSDIQRRSKKKIGE